MKRWLTALVPLLVFALLASAAPATTPGQVGYQGLLLDDQGQPVTGNVDFVFTLFDADQNGSSLWSESHPGVAVLDGIYDVRLGESTPITPSVVAGGSLYLEIEVAGETLAPRQRLVAVPYALQADTASVAESVGGFAGAYFTQLLQYVAFDGGDPPNDDPREGLADADGDGVANFLEADNDDDGLSDTAELAQASDINLVTPTVTDIAPEPVEASLATTVTISGTNFEPGLGVVFGSQSPTPQNLGSNSFEVEVGPQSVGTTSVVVTRSNGESAVTSFEFVSFQPLITSLVPSYGNGSASQIVTVNGSGFVAGLAVSFGSENPTPQNLTATSFDVSVGPQAAGPAQVTVSYPSGLQDSEAFYFFEGVKTVFVTSTVYDGSLGGLAGADAACAARAAAASLPGTFKAWIADATGSPSSRFTQTSTYFLVDGTTLVAGSYGDLVDGSLQNAIHKNEFGATTTGLVWTNVGVDGSAQPHSCSNWSTASNATNGRFGQAGLLDGGWTSLGAYPCDELLHLYCFEQ